MERKTGKQATTRSSSGQLHERAELGGHAAGLALLRTSKVAFELTGDEMIALTLDATLGRDPSIATEEALRFFEQVKNEVAELTERGIAIDIPFE